MARTAFLHPFCPPTNEQFVELVRGAGVFVYDSRGREYIDGFGSLWYCQIGHGRREMADAIAKQVETLEAYHTFAPYTNRPAEMLCQAIVERSPLADGRVFLTSGGSEAVDTVLKLARLTQRLRGTPERHIVIARSSAYHGVTYGGMTAQGIAPNREGFGALVPDIVHVEQHDLEAVRHVFEQNPGRVAAVLTEPLQAAGGVHPPRPGYLQGLRDLCDEHGAWLILDEVVCGFGRLGAWFGAVHYGVRPDLITFAKGVSSGYLPLGGVILSRTVCDVLEADPGFFLRHGFTYSGHPTCCAAGLANIAILERERLLERAPVLGGHFARGLAALAAEGLLAEVRGDGAVWGAALRADIDAVAVRDHMLRNGVLARPLPGNTIAWCPPLVMTDEQAERCVAAFGAALRESA